MWFRARKSDYKTKDYNPDKRAKRQTYDNKPNYKSEHREPGEGNGDLARPLIPYDARIDDKGPILVKKQKPRNVDVKDVGPKVAVPIINLTRPEETLSKKKKDKSERQVDGKRLYSVDEKQRQKPYDQSKLESIKLDKGGPDKMDDDRLMSIKVDKDKSKPYDNKKLMTIEVDKGDRKPFDDKKLMTIEVDKRDRKPFDDKKLMTIEVDKGDRKPFDDKKLMTIEVDKGDRKPYDDKKLMTEEIRKPNKQELHDDRLMIKPTKIERSKLHDERLLTVDERVYPSKTMKRISEDIANYEGDYVSSLKTGKESHPSTRHMASKKQGLPFFKRTQELLSVFWLKVWPWDLQPSYVTEKKPKVKRDKKEGQIWDNTVHPDTWNTKPEQAESGEEQ